MVKIQVESKVQSVAGWSKVKCAEKWMDLTSSLLSSLQCTWYLCISVATMRNRRSFCLGGSEIQKVCHNLLWHAEEDPMTSRAGDVHTVQC